MNDLFLEILKEELVLALGCTEPTCIVICANKCVEVLGKKPEKIEVFASGNMIKNVKGVFIPNSKGLMGIENAVLIGCLVKTGKANLEKLSHLSDDLLEEVEVLRSKNIVTLTKKETKAKLYIEIKMYSGDEYASVEIMHGHTNITKITKNDKPIYYNPCSENDFNSNLTDRKELSIKRIFDFCQTVPLEDLKKILECQAKYNLEVANEGMKSSYGLEVGRTLLNGNEDDVYNVLKAYAAAGSDARMSGCDKPVVINSGSGNQGLTIAIPIAIYKVYKNLNDDDFYRALALANLIPIHIKTKIGKLSAFCGAISAAMGVGAALSFIERKDYQVVSNTITNTIANLTGVICDGAKCTCAIKIASGLDAAILAHKLALNGKTVDSGVGIIGSDVEESISSLSMIASQGMGQTDDMIIDIMTK